MSSKKKDDKNDKNEKGKTVELSDDILNALYALAEPSTQTYDPSETVAYIARRFTEVYNIRELALTLSELSRPEQLAIALAKWINDMLDKAYGITSPLGQLVDNIVLLRVSTGRAGRREILSLVSRITGTPEFNGESLGRIKRLFGKE